MSILHRSGATPVYEAAHTFVEEALRHDGSIFSPGVSRWTAPLLEELTSSFADAEDTSGGSFFDKLDTQLAGVSDEAVQLFAEVFFVQVLPAVSVMKPTTKRDRLLRVLRLRDDDPSLPEGVERALEGGLANPGVAFGTLRYYQLRFLIRFAAHWKSLGPDTRADALADPWTFKGLVAAVPVDRAQAQRELLLHLVHPDTFEAIASRAHKQLIAKAFAELGTDDEDVDRRLLSIRTALEEHRGGRVDYYLDEDLHDRWAGAVGDQEPRPGAEAPAWLRRSEEALRRKGQLVFYGPPGTGKTYRALRLAIAHLLRDELDDAGIAELLLSDDLIKERSDELGWPGDGNTVWLFVANQQHGSFDELLEAGWVDWMVEGRTRAKNFSTMVPGDLVIGYEGEPRSRVVALARVLRHLLDENDQLESVRLAAIGPVRGGPSFQELQSDEVVGASEGPRSRMQGSAFALEEAEARRLLEMLAERDQEIDVEQLRRNDLTAQLERITFHPSYAYEDFVEGYRPERRGEGLRLALRRGLFARMCRTAYADPDSPYVLLIDELNRADVPKVLGELVTVLELDKRDQPVRLAQSQEELRVPRNLSIIATMNTADRSIRLLDAALRRRFAFEEIAPAPELLAGTTVAGMALDDLLRRLNERIGSVVGQEYRIGHSYLLDHGASIAEEAQLAAALRHDILPQVEEVAGGEGAVLIRLLGEGLVDPVLGVLRAEVRDDDDSLLAAVRQEFVTS